MLYQSAALGAVLADLHWLLWAILYPWCSRAKKEKNPSPLIHQTSTCQTLAQENYCQFPFSLSHLLSLFSTPQITVMFLNGQKGSAPCLSILALNTTVYNKIKQGFLLQQPTINFTQHLHLKTIVPVCCVKCCIEAITDMWMPWSRVQAWDYNMSIPTQFPIMNYRI